MADLTITGLPAGPPPPSIQESYIRANLQPESEPILTDAEITQLLNFSKRADSYGRIITDPNWIPTYDLASAIADGWRMKAAKIAGNFEFTDSNLTLKRNQIYDNCLKQANEWSKRCMGSTQVSNPWNLRYLSDIEEKFFEPQTVPIEIGD